MVNFLARLDATRNFELGKKPIASSDDDDDGDWCFTATFVDKVG